MSRLTTNPANLSCPDFDTPIYEPARAHLISKTTHLAPGQAAASLKNDWITNNVAEKAAWDVQVASSWALVGLFPVKTL